MNPVGPQAPPIGSEKLPRIACSVNVAPERTGVARNFKEVYAIEVTTERTLCHLEFQTVKVFSVATKDLRFAVAEQIVRSRRDAVRSCRSSRS